MATVDWAGVADKWKGMFVVALKKVGCFIALGLPPAPASDPPPRPFHHGGLATPFFLWRP